MENIHFNVTNMLEMNTEESENDPTKYGYVNEKILQMIQKMGYKSGTGLGKHGQGIVEAVEIKGQLGRQGFGVNSKKRIDLNETWDFTQENVEVKEKITWVKNNESTIFDYDTLTSYLKQGEAKSNIDEECEFCDKEILHNVLAAKGIFDELDILDLYQARAKANPFETIRSVFFMNRAALKLANIDAATDFMFSRIDESPHHQKETGPYYFADVCAGPGGFTEYLLWRRKWLFKGFGMTLKNKDDFKLTDSSCITHLSFQAFYGTDGDGNICSPANIDDFKEKVLQETDGEGVHIMTSDGGFSVEGNENMQEVLSKNIYVCQCLVALEILRTHGHFVTKLFDVFTTFSVGLIYLMYKCFEKVSIFKPNSSRPANSERYLICKNLQNTQNVTNIRKYLRHLADKMWELRDDPETDIVDIFHIDIMKKDKQFYDYICGSNNSIGRNQIVALKKLGVFCRNPTLSDPRQEDLRKQCLEYWQIPDLMKTVQPKFTISDFLSKIVNAIEFLPFSIKLVPRCITIDDLINSNTIKSVDDFHYFPLHCTRKSNICNFFVGIGGHKVYRLFEDRWIKVKNLFLAKGTLLYGELVKEKIELKDNVKINKSGVYKYSLHVIDALRLGDAFLGDLRFQERRNLINTYCKSINREFHNSIRIRPKIANTLSSITTHSLILSNEISQTKYSELPVMDHNSRREVLEINSILLLKTDKDQSFHSTQVLRLQLFIDEEESEEYPPPLDAFIKFVKSKL